MDTNIVDEIRDLLETAGFSMKTAKMAIGIGADGKIPLMTLSERLNSPDEESQEASAVAVEALGHARDSYYELLWILDGKQFEDLGCELRFWSAFKWINDQLFFDQVKSKSQQLLRQELTEALRLTARVLDRLALLSPSGDRRLLWSGSFK